MPLHGDELVVATDAGAAVLGSTPEISQKDPVTLQAHCNEILPR